jgi:hypothetical protein
MEYSSLHENIIPQLMEITFIREVIKDIIPNITEENQKQIMYFQPLLNFDDICLLRTQHLNQVYVSYNIEIYLRRILIGIREHPSYAGGIHMNCFSDLEMASK